MEAPPSRIIIPDIRDTLSKARRTPAHCLYCTAPAKSWEHALPDAIGGRLQAPILCPAHNNAIAAAADEPMVTQFQPIAHMLDIRRQRGPRGTPFRAQTDAGERVIVERDGHVHRYKRLDVVTKGKSGKINFAKGELAALHDLKKRNALEDPSKPVIVTVERPPIVNFEVAVAREAECGVLKIALHFLAGFVTDVDLTTAQQLLPYIMAKQVAGGMYVRTLPLDGAFFPQSWPPCHEIRSYPEGAETYVTVLLFGLYGFQVRLPITTRVPLRYFQPLIDAVTPVFERNDHTRSFTWETRLTDADRDSFETNLHFRHDKLMGFAQWRMRRNQCKAAAERAAINMYTLRTSFLEAYHAELQQEAFSSDDIALLLSFARQAIPAGMPVWELPLEQFVA